MPAHFEAREFFTTAHSHTKAEIEARLLAGQDDAAIATRCGLSVESVGVYHGLYFDVRPRLDAEAWVFNAVLGTRMNGSLREQDRDVIVKLVGYQFGHIVLDALLEYYTQPPLILREVKRLALHELPALADQLRIQALLLALTLENRRCDRRAAALMQNLLARLRVAEENVAHRAPTSPLLDETVCQRLRAAGTPLVAETLIDIGTQAAGLRAATTDAAVQDTKSALHVAGDDSEGVYGRDLHSCQSSKPVKSRSAYRSGYAHGDGELTGIIDEAEGSKSVLQNLHGQPQAVSG